MDLNRYKIFLSVADSGSFTAAAAAWNYTPSGVVHLINASPCSSARGAAST